MSEKTYLEDIKFRNAVKRIEGIGHVRGKNSYGRHAVYIDPVNGRDKNDKHTFIVGYRGGDSGNDKIVIDALQNELRVVRKLVLAGFEMVEVEHFGWNGWGNVVAWRKADEKGSK